MLLIKRNENFLTECLDNVYLCMMTIVMSIENAKYSCEYCEYKASQKGDLKNT